MNGPMAGPGSSVMGGGGMITPGVGIGIGRGGGIYGSGGTSIGMGGGIGGLSAAKAIRLVGIDAGLLAPAGALLAIAFIAGGALARRGSRHICPHKVVPTPPTFPARTD